MHIWHLEFTLETIVFVRIDGFRTPSQLNDWSPRVNYVLNLEGWPAAIL